MPGHLSKVREAFPEVDIILLRRTYGRYSAMAIIYKIDIETKRVDYCTTTEDGTYSFRDLCLRLSHGFRASRSNVNIIEFLDSLFSLHSKNYRIIVVNKEKFKQLQQLYTLGKL